ncbi:hypothetical protein ACDA63_00665 [Uliginosibacterium sp. sgz301328]|uniref:hypothetical protein n=1 Tax=Uliginosibacterium sp. sgz301328 TaxID=3243764 RepID=UPI00359F0367
MRWVGLIVAIWILAACERAAEPRSVQPAQAESSIASDANETPWGTVNIAGPGPTSFMPCEAMISPASTLVLSMSWEACATVPLQQIKAVGSQTEDGETRISVRHYSTVDGRIVIYSYECASNRPCNGDNGVTWHREARSLTLNQTRLDLFNSGGARSIPLAEQISGTLHY